MGKPNPHEPAPSDRSDEKKKRKRKRERTEAESTNKGRDLDDGGEGKGQMEIQRDGKHLNKRERKNGQGPNVGPVHRDEHNENLKHANIDPAAATGSEEAKMQVEVEATKKKKGKHKKCESAGANDNIRTDGPNYQEGQAEVPSEEGFAMLYKENIKFKSCGLENFKRTCYLNVTLQCLLHTKPLLAYLLSSTYGKVCCSLKSEWCLLCALRGHARSLSEHSSPTHPDPIIMHLEVIAGPAFKLNKDQDAFKLNKDQDAHEFMAHAIRKLQYDSLNKHNDKKVEAADTIINHIFGGELFSEVRCTACGYTSPKHEQMQDISVGIGLFPKSLEKCLQRDFDEKIHDYDCPKCKKKVEAERIFTIEDSPNVLNISLKRFSGSMKKLKTDISYPMVLDMTQFMRTDNGDNLYDLCALVIHVDIGTFGHYICYCKDYMGKWSQFDDREVKAVLEEDVLNKEAYMLMYIRRNVLPKPLLLEVSMKQERQRVAIEPCSFPWLDDAMSPSNITGSTDGKKEEDIMMNSPCENVLQNLSPEAQRYRTELHDRIFDRSLDTLELKEETKERLRKAYWIAEDTKKEVVLQNINEALEHYEKTGHFRLPSRGKGSDVYDDELGAVCMTDKGVYQSKSTLKEQRIASSMYVIRDHLQADMLLQQRTLFYLDTALYGLSSTSDDIIAAICNLLKCTRRSLNLTVSSVGSIIGPVVLHIKGGVVIDCWRCGVAGTKIPDEAYYITSFTFFRHVRFILVVEKETVFKLLTGINFHKTYKCIIITGSGQPDIVTRFVVWLLKRRLKVPVYGFADANPCGIRILCTYKFGSQRRSFDNVSLAVPELIWIGLDSCDVKPVCRRQPLIVKNVAQKAAMNVKRTVQNVKKAEEKAEKAAKKAKEKAEKAAKKAEEKAEKAAKKAAQNKTMLDNLLKLKRIQNEPGWVDRIKGMLYTCKFGDIEGSLDYLTIEEYLARMIPEMKDPKKDDETKSKVSKALNFENVTSNDGTERDSRNARKRKRDAINQDPASPAAESKEKKSTLSEEADEKDSKNKQKSRKGLVIKDMSEVALNGCKVSINYVAKLKDGTVLHSNGNGKPYKFILGSEKVIPGWNVGIEGMHLGDKRRLTVRPSMRKTGSKPPIGEEYKKSTIIYDVELVKIKTS